jgi:hypothetical protein
LRGGFSLQPNSIRFSWTSPEPAKGFRTGVSLHGHTMHSEECLSFLPRHLERVPGIAQVVRYYQGAPHHVDFGRAWWTPPLAPAAALNLERGQIAGLGLRPLVSLTDHDNIDAGLALGVAEGPADTPISVEWTVPFEGTFFHLGIHNIPAANAGEWMGMMGRYTSCPREELLPLHLDELARTPDVLIVLNHPFWLEDGVEDKVHREALPHLLRDCIGWLDAFELNGTRPWAENAETIQLASDYDRPLISGGDRHACEPSACINLTDATTFAEFVSEIHAGVSSLLFLPQYQEPMSQRILEAARDIVRRYPEYPDRERWQDRIFYRCADGLARSLSQIWGKSEPRFLDAAAALVQFLAAPHLRPAWRFLRAEQQVSQ